MNNREVIIQGEGILNLIPQRPPIVMVDSFFGIEENHSYSGLTVTADNIFCETMKLFTEITVIQEVFDITLISAQVKVEDKLIAECRMKIFIKKE